VGFARATHGVGIRGGGPDTICHPSVPHDMHRSRGVCR
jgi:hypothetical protein